MTDAPASYDSIAFDENFTGRNYFSVFDVK